MSNSKKNILKKFSLNRVIWYLTLSDIFTWGLFLIINVFVGLYLSTKFNANIAEIIGIGTAIFYLAKGGFQIPIGLITDKIKKDRDDILFLLAGNILFGIPYLFYPIINSQWIYFLLQFMAGLGAAMNLVNWRKLFAKNLDKGNEGLDYAVYDTILSIAMIIFSVIAGSIANMGKDYFDLVMIVVGLLMISSGIWIIAIYFTRFDAKRQ